jgi:DNA-binding transcriptional LysR family regulator
LISQLESGEVDVALGSFPTLFAGVLEQTLFTEEYVCVVPRASLPKGQLTLSRFKASSHIMVDARHLGHIHEEVERKLLSLVGKSNVRIMTESFLMSAHVAEQSDLILTVPSHVGDVLSTDRVRILKPPIELPGFAVKQYWHERFNQDAGNIWLRSGIARLRKMNLGR